MSATPAPRPGTFAPRSCVARYCAARHYCVARYCVITRPCVKMSERSSVGDRIFGGRRRRAAWNGDRPSAVVVLPALGYDVKPSEHAGRNVRPRTLESRRTCYEISVEHLIVSTEDYVRLINTARRIMFKSKYFPPKTWVSAFKGIRD